MRLNNILSRVARGGPNQRGRARGSTRPAGEGKGLISVARSLFKRR